MELVKTVTAYGHTFSLNVAIADGMNYNNTRPFYKHFCLIQLGDDEVIAHAKAHVIAKKFGDDYKCTLRATPIVESLCQDIEVIK